MIWHVTIGARGRQPLWTAPAELAHLLRALARAAGPGLLLFCVVDDHLHAVVRATRSEVARMASALGRVLWAAGRPSEPARVRPVDGRDHQEGLVAYVLRQPVRHDLGVHPAAWPGSCFADLVGARRVPGFDPDAIRRELPRLDPGRFWRAVDLAPVNGEVDGEVVRTLGVRGVLEGAAAAIAADPDRRTDDAVDARAVAVRLALAADLGQAHVAASLGITDRAVRILRARDVDPTREAVIARQLRLRHRLLTAAPVAPNPSEQRSIARSRVLAGDPWTGTRGIVTPGQV